MQVRRVMRRTVNSMSFPKYFCVLFEYGRVVLKHSKATLNSWNKVATKMTGEQNFCPCKA